ncbi:MAG: phosphodiester glycosidase family protein [Nanoarchaeota archaeon]
MNTYSIIALGGLVLGSILPSYARADQDVPVRREVTIEQAVQGEFDGLEGKFQQIVWNRMYLDITSITIDPAKYAIELRQANEFGSDLGKLIDVVSQTGAIGGINGGFYEGNKEPSGLVVQDGKKLHDITSYGGSGIFFIDKAGKAGIMSRAEYAGQDFKLALQCGPLLVKNGESAVKSYAVSDRSNRRSVVALDKEGHVDFLVVDPIKLKDLSDFLAERYVSAMNLDGGPSTKIYLNDDGQVTQYGSNYVAVNFLLIKEKPN